MTPPSRVPYAQAMPHGIGKDAPFDLLWFVGTLVPYAPLPLSCERDLDVAIPQRFLHRCEPNFGNSNYVPTLASDLIG